MCRHALHPLFVVAVTAGMDVCSVPSNDKVRDLDITTVICWGKCYTELLLQNMFECDLDGELMHVVQ